MVSTRNPFVEALWRVPWENLLSARFRIHQCCMNISVFWQFRKEVFLASASLHGEGCLWILNMFEYDTKQNSPKTFIIIIDNSEFISISGRGSRSGKGGLNIFALEQIHFILDCFTFNAFLSNVITLQSDSILDMGKLKDHLNDGFFLCLFSQNFVFTYYVQYTYSLNISRQPCEVGKAVR